MHIANYDLKEDVRTYWTIRSETFDASFGHRIPAGAEADAWSAEIRAALGPTPLRVLELACGTGEVTRLLLDLGHSVTALDFSESMLARASRKHEGRKNARLLLADAESTMEPDGAFDAVVCRHLVWTLTQPAAAFAEWRRLLTPGGRLLIFDGDWAQPTASGRVARRLIAALDALFGADADYDGGLSDRHAAIMKRLPFGGGLTAERLQPLLAAAGFGDFRIGSHASIGRAQRKGASLRNRLRTLVWRRFTLAARRM